MHSPDIEQKVIDVFKRVFPELNSESVNLDQPQNQFENWDSFAHLELVTALENEFGVSFKLEEVVTVSSPRGFVDRIAEKKRG